MSSISSSTAETHAAISILMLDVVKLPDLSSMSLVSACLYLLVCLILLSFTSAFTSAGISSENSGASHLPCFHCLFFFFFFSSVVGVSSEDLPRCSHVIFCSWVQYPLGQGLENLSGFLPCPINGPMSHAGIGGSRRMVLALCPHMGPFWSHHLFLTIQFFSQFTGLRSAPWEPSMELASVRDGKTAGDLTRSA
jgi:hypothetical protein